MQTRIVADVEIAARAVATAQSTDLSTLPADVNTFEIGGYDRGAGTSVYAMGTVMARLDEVLTKHGDSATRLAMDVLKHIEAMKAAAADMDDSENASTRAASAFLENNAVDPSLAPIASAEPTGTGPSTGYDDPAA